MNQPLHNISIVVSFILFHFFASAQLVNIEDMRIKGDSMPLSGGLNFGLNYKESSKSFLDIRTGLHLQYKKGKDLFLVICDYGMAKGDGETFDKSGFIHLRYNYKVTPWLRWEIFGQSQFNELLKVNQRELLGSGPRFKLSDKEKAKVYLGILYMYEYEEVLSSSIIERNHRLSSYISYTIQLGPNFKLVSTSYYQPKINYIADYRITSQHKLKIGINKNLSFTCSFNYLYDSRSAEGVPAKAYSIENGISWVF